MSAQRMTQNNRNDHLSHIFLVSYLSWWVSSQGCFCGKFDAKFEDFGYGDICVFVKAFDLNQPEFPPMN